MLQYATQHLLEGKESQAAPGVVHYETEPHLHEVKAEGRQRTAARPLEVRSSGTQGTDALAPGSHLT